MVAPLVADARVEAVVVDALTPEWIAFAHKVAAVVVATAEDPIAALRAVAATRIETPIVVATTVWTTGARAALDAGGAFASLPMPLTSADVGRLVGQLAGHACPMRVDGIVRLLLDPIGLVARWRDRTIHLSQREFAVLYVLSTHAGEPVAAEELTTRVWGRSAADEKARQILDVYIFQLRRKLERLGLRGAISTVRGVGYALVARAGAAEVRRGEPPHATRVAANPDVRD